MEITLYSTHCPKCKVLEKKLAALNLDFKLIDDNDEVIKFGESVKMNSAPILVVDSRIFDFVNANKYLSTLQQ